MTNLSELKKNGEAPEWLSEDAYQMLQGGYLLDKETPRGMYKRVAKSVAKALNQDFLEEIFFDYMWKNWLCPATPILANAGTNRGLPVSCLTGDTWINTKDGGKQIKDIQVGDLVLSHTGKWRKVLNKMVKKPTDPIYELSLATRTTKLKITGNHLVYTNLGWVRVDELDPLKHYVATNKKIEFIENQYVLDMKKYCPYKFIEIDNVIYKQQETKDARPSRRKEFCKNYSSIKTSIVVDEDVAWFLGIWLAEGSRSKNARSVSTGIRFTLSTDETHFAEKIQKIAQEKFGLSSNCNTSEWKNPKTGKINSWITVDVHSTVLGNFFDKEFGIGAKNKNMATWMFDLPKNVLSSLIKGILDGDGSKNAKGGNKITLANPKLILSIYNCLLKLDVACSLQMQSKAGELSSTKHVYTIDMYEGYEMSKARYRPSSAIQFGDLNYCPIRCLEKTELEVDEVFDIEVEEDHSFSACGVIVHNCFSSYVPDTTIGIMNALTEVAMLSKYGGGTAIHFSDVRSKGSPISKGGVSDGVVPFLKMFDSTILGISQGSTRRGACAAYLDIEHGDFYDFLRSRRPTGDVNRQCLNLHHGVCISDEFVQKVKNGDKEARERWQELIKTRFETGEPYIFFKDAANNQAPEQMKKTGISIKGSNLCSEIFQPTDENHTLVCCLSSLNLYRWEEWKNSDLVKHSIYFLDGVMTIFLENSKNIPGFERAWNLANKARTLGLGVLGFHSLLQKQKIPFESLQAYVLNKLIFKQIKEQADLATQELAQMYGSPLWMMGTGKRNMTLLAIAPTASNALIASNVSQGIEPWIANCFAQKSAKGTFVRKNNELIQILEEKGKNTNEVWDSILKNDGSVQHLDFLTEEEKQVFLTAREINQFTIVKLAAERQKFIDQGQSLNLFFPANSDAKYINQVHLLAHELGLKSLYYLRSTSVLKANSSVSESYKREMSECSWCEG